MAGRAASRGLTLQPCPGSQRRCWRADRPATARRLQARSTETGATSDRGWPGGVGTPPRHPWPAQQPLECACTRQLGAAPLWMLHTHASNLPVATCGAAQGPRNPPSFALPATSVVTLGGTVTALIRGSMHVCRRQSSAATLSLMRHTADQLPRNCNIDSRVNMNEGCSRRALRSWGA